MYGKLSKLVLPVDDVVEEMLKDECFRERVKRFRTQSGNAPIKFLITLDFVADNEVKKKTREYISRLLEDPKKYGYLYFLKDERLLVPLNLNFQGAEILVDCVDKFDIMDAVEKLASESACRNMLQFEITLLEIYYFYVRLLNRNLTWLAVESLLCNVRTHTHLIMSPDREYSFRELEETGSACP